MSGITKTSQDESSGPPASQVVARSQSADKFEGQGEGSSESRVRRVSDVIDSLPLGSATVSVITETDRSRNYPLRTVARECESECPNGSGEHSLGPLKPRIRKISDVIDSFGLGSKTPSPTYLPQRPPVFKFQSHSSQSSSSSQDVPGSSGSSTYGQSRTETPASDRHNIDLLEYPLKSERKPHHLQEVASVVRHNDETDAKPKVEESNEEQEPSYLLAEKLALVEAVMPAEPDDDEYPMDLRRRGVAAIFNNDRFESEPARSGSAVDVEALRRSLSYLGFEVITHNNLTRSQIADELDLLVKADYHDCNCFCMAVLTHGEAPELLHAKDGVYRQSELWTPFTGEKCPGLAGKPKIFFIQACRGEGLDKGVRLVKYSNSSETDASPRWSYVIPSWADFLIAHSSVEGFFSWRNPKDGTWWVQTLCRELEARCATSDLLNILTIVNRRVALEFESFVLGRPDLSGCKEIPSFTSTLMREVYFRPRLLQPEASTSTP